MQLTLSIENHDVRLSISAPRFLDQKWQEPEVILQPCHKNVCGTCQTNLQEVCANTLQYRESLTQITNEVHVIHQKCLCRNLYARDSPAVNHLSWFDGFYVPYRRLDSLTRFFAPGYFPKRTQKCLCVYVCKKLQCILKTRTVFLRATGLHHSGRCKRFLELAK